MEVEAAQGRWDFDRIRERRCADGVGRTSTGDR